MSVTRGAVRTMVSMSEGHNSNPAFQPTLQVISVKAIPSANSERHRTILSDGEHYVNGMLATQLNHLVQTEQLTVNCMIQVEEFMNNVVQGKTVIILLKISIVGYQQQRIGNPVDVESASAVVGTNAMTTTTTTSSAQPMYNRTNHANAMPTSVTSSLSSSSSSSYNKMSNAGGGNMMMSTTSSNHSYAPDRPSSSSSNPYGGSGGGKLSSSSPYGTSTTGSLPPIVRSGMTSTQHYTPIANLNMYQNRWTILARVTSKSDIRTWSNVKGEGSLFSVELLDSSMMDIRATFFKEAVDKFYNMLQLGKVYTFSGGRLKVANQQYNTCKSNFEITFDQNSEIHLDNDAADIEEQVYDFCKIANLEQCEEGKNVDILAVVQSVGEPVTLTSKKTGRELTKCDLVLVDDSQVQVNLTVWGEQATRAPSDFAHCPVVAFRRARVSDFGGKSLSASNGGISIQPKVPQAFQLQEWYKASSVGGNHGSGIVTKSLSSSGGAGAGKVDNLVDRKTISSIKQDNLGYGSPDKPDWISFKGVVTFIKKDKEGGAWYTACPNANEPCRNRFKVTQTTDGQWFCDKCQSTYPNCVRRWIFSATVADDTSSTWISLFNEHAEQLLHATADEVYNSMTESGGDQDKYDSFFMKATNTEWIMRCKVKNEMVGDEARVKTSVTSLAPVNYVKESCDLLTELAKF